MCDLEIPFKELKKSKGIRQGLKYQSYYHYGVLQLTAGLFTVNFLNKEVLETLLKPP